MQIDFLGRREAPYLLVVFYNFCAVNFLGEGVAPRKNHRRRPFNAVKN